jgi:hypothetical protein
MSRTSARAKARRFKECLLDHGVPQVSLELHIGRPVYAPASAWDSLDVVTNFSHHTVSRYDKNNLTPCLSLVKDGSATLPGPLCNGYGGWDLTARIITMGYANHPGEGGPIRVPKRGGGFYSIPKDSARKYTWGWEFEGGLRAEDWDRELKNPRNGMTMTFREFMGRCAAGTQDFFGLPVGAHLEHLTWAPSRKIDRLGYTQAKGIQEIKKFSDKVEELRMDEQKFQELVKTTPLVVERGPDNTPREVTLENVVRDLERTQEKILQAVNEVNKKLENLK